MPFVDSNNHFDMNVNLSTELCRLCLETSAGLVNIFERYEDATVASIFVEHFWFQITRNDGMSQWVCETCWSCTKSFHHFYKKLELLHKNCLHSTVLVKVDEIKQERPVSPMEDAVEAYHFVTTDYDEGMDIIMKPEDTQTLSEENSCDLDNNDTGCDQSDEHQPSVDEAKNTGPSPSENEKQNAEIYRFFRMKCEICDFDFDTLKNAMKHYRQVHNARGYLTCCGNKYWRRNPMLDHIQRHVNPNGYHCDLCAKSYSEKRSLRTHMEYHVRGHNCSLCKGTFPSALKLKYHVRDKHPADASVKFPCDQCGKIYPTKLSLTGHIRNVHTLSLDHVCDECGRKFKYKNNLKIHKTMEHSTTTPVKVQCDICGVWLKHHGRLKVHLKRHQDMQEVQNGNAKVVNCPICEKTVPQRLLAGHIRNSHGERKHQCTFCDKAFKRIKVLKEHIASIHTGVDLYSWTYCEKTFKSNANMYSHRKKAHLAEWTRDRAEKDKGN